MQNAVDKAAFYLPQRLKEAVLSLSDTQKDTVRELRLRANAGFTLSTDAGERFLQSNGEWSTFLTPLCLIATPNELAECVKRLCGYAVHTHENELRQGFLTADGCRAGLGGTVVLNEAGKPCSMREIRSICLRVARLHEGFADRALRFVASRQTGGVLVCGLPSCGKTSLLRDMAQGLSEGRFAPRARVAVVDERFELSFGGALRGCDVIRGLKKAAAIERAVRCLAPEYLVFDEWISAEETAAVSYAVASGVRVITGVHAPSAAAALVRTGMIDFPIAVELSSDHRYRVVTEE